MFLYQTAKYTVLPVSVMNREYFPYSAAVLCTNNINISIMMPVFPKNIRSVVFPCSVENHC